MTPKGVPYGRFRGGERQGGAAGVGLLGVGYFWCMRVGALLLALAFFLFSFMGLLEEV